MRGEARQVQRPFGGSPGTITRILLGSEREPDRGLAEAIAAVYRDLQKIAGRQLARERRTPTFDTECLIHEAYLRLVKQDRVQWRNRHHLFAVAARVMRRVLVDRARNRGAAKRGSGALRTELKAVAPACDSLDLDALTLDDALRDLKRLEPQLAQIVELRFFGGLNNPEIAAIQGVTPMTVIRRWRLARAWLRRYLVQQHSTA